MLDSMLLRAPDDQSGGSFATRSGPSLVATDPSEAARTKPLAELLAAVPDTRARGNTETVVTGLTYRSSEVRPGWLFFCVPGARVDGHRFAADACAAGASVVVVERWLDVSCAQVLVPSVPGAMGPLSARFWGSPADALIISGW